MKRLLFSLLIAAAAAPVFAADVGVSVNVGQPGFYGRIDIGNAPPPQVIYAQPIIIQRIAQPPPPIYLRVPPGHAKKWRKHCQRYDACGRPVYFVRDDWYNNVYVPHYRKTHGGPSDGRPGQGPWKGQGQLALGRANSIARAGVAGPLIGSRFRPSMIDEPREPR